MADLFLYKNIEGKIMEVKIITGTAEEIAKVLPAIDSSKEQVIDIDSNKISCFLSATIRDISQVDLKK